MLELSLLPRRLDFAILKDTHREYIDAACRPYARVTKSFFAQ